MSKALLSGQKGTLDWDDQLWKHRKKLIRALFDQFVSALAGKELIRLLSLSKSFEKDGQMKMVIEMFRVHFPGKLTINTCTFLNAPWKLTATGRSPLS